MSETSTPTTTAARDRSAVPRSVRWRTLLALLAAVVALAPTARPAAASCAVDDRPLEQHLASAPTVFVGTVVSTRHDGTTADVAVEEIWKGGQDIRRVVVQGGSGQDGMATSVDRGFTAGTRYLFLPRAQGSLFTDNSCSPTREWSDELVGLRPAEALLVDANEPAASTADPVALVAVVAGLAIAAAAAAWAWRRRHPRP